MSVVCRRNWFAAVIVGLILCGGGTGCQTCSTCPSCPQCQVPRELRKTTMPTYVVESPDILLIDAVQLVPLPPYRIGPFDSLLINVPGAYKDNPINALYPVDPDGTINLGLVYGGTVQVMGMTLEEARLAVEKHLEKILAEPKATVLLGQTRGMQQIRGEHLVRPDGTVNLGTYGSVYVAGLSLPEVKLVIEAHLSQFLSDPEISVDVAGYNSKVYYVIADGAGFGEQVYRLPHTGNETVLDAISAINGLPGVASKRRIWVARPNPSEYCCQQILPVQWKAITQGGSTATNYQLLPGDRLYLASDPLIALDTRLARAIAPIERLLGVTILGTGTIQTVRSAAQGANNSNNFFGGF